MLLSHFTPHQCVERAPARRLGRRDRAVTAGQRPQGARASPRTATAPAARVQTGRMASDPPAARSPSTSTSLMLEATCVALTEVWVVDGVFSGPQNGCFAPVGVCTHGVGGLLPPLTLPAPALWDMQ